MKKWLLIGIIVLGLALRLIGLQSHPAGFTPDEASFGYDAYSILKTGKDQWGSTLPLVFKSFGDDKLPVYTYLTVPFIAAFDLNEVSVRLPNAIIGTLAILIVYLLVRELFDEKIALITSFLLAISPWHTMLSRGAFEANLTTFFLPLGILLFLKSLKSPKLLFLSFLVFLINIFTYHTARILTPIIFLFLIFKFKDALKSNKSSILASVLATIILLISLAGVLFGGSRIASSAIFNLSFADDRYLAQVIGEPSLISKIFYNKPIYIVRQFITNYLSYFSPQFLITNGPAEGTYGMIPGVGVIYFIEIFFLIGFIVNLIKEKLKNINLILFWILISPIPAALTKGPGYAANRLAFIIPALCIASALGAVFIYEKLKNKNYKKIFQIVCSIVLLFNFVYVFEKYLVGQTINHASDMIYGTKELVRKISETNSKEIIVSKSVSEPQIYIAFYTKLNPIEYQNEAKNWTLVNGWVDQQGSYKLGKYLFRNINYSVDKNLENSILAGKPNEFPSELKPDFQVNYPNLKPAYFVINTK